MDPADHSTDWRTQFRADSRERIVSKILETLKRHLPSSGEVELEDLTTLAKRSEENVYGVAVSKIDYVRRITIMMLRMDTCNTLNPIDPVKQLYKKRCRNETTFNIPPRIFSHAVMRNSTQLERAVSFVSWSEELDTEPETYGQFRFYLYSPKLGNVLAAKGDFDPRNPQYEYWTDTLFVNTFGNQFGRANGRRWNNHDDVVNWLNGFISSSSGGSSSNDANTTIRQEAANQESDEVPTALDCFFKVMIGNFDTELSIPPKYCRIFNHCTTNQRIILRNGSRSWIVVVNNYVMRAGWEEFVKDHKIKQGEFLVFNHAEGNIYDVKIFSCSGCGNLYPWSSDNRDRTTANVIATMTERQEEAGNA